MTSTEIALTLLLVVPAVGMFLIFIATVFAVIHLFGKH